VTPAAGGGLGERQYQAPAGPAGTTPASSASAGTAPAGAVRIDPALVPIRVAEIDLDEAFPVARPAGGPPDGGAVTGPGEVLALVRRSGRPLGMVQAAVGPADDASALLAAAARAAHGSLVHGAAVPHDAAVHSDAAALPSRRRDGRERPMASVVIATRERPETLARCLDSVARLDYPRLEVVVVDNAPRTDATERLVRERYGDAVRYVREPVAGLASAHNRGIAESLGEIIAFTDDDVIVDRHWLTALVDGFQPEPGSAGTGDDAAAGEVGCVTGLILPARLDTAAQASLEAHGGFAKGFARRSFSLARPPADDPLFPFTAGRLGSGANMAFRASALRAVGGFDPATGTGTPARGGDDLYGFVRVLTAGHTLVYQPEAVVWHHHRERPEDLDTQAYGYGAGLTAYLTAVIAREPRMLPALLRRLPGGVRYALTRTAAAEAAVAGHAWPARLSRLERRGMLHGPIGYLRSRRLVRGLPLPWEAPRHGD